MPTASNSSSQGISTAVGAVRRSRWVNAYAVYVLLILVMVSACNFFDRFLLIINMESIKRDLRLSDTQLGLLTGFAFSAVYTIAGIFVARCADVGNRRNIIVVGLALWSSMTMLCGAVRGFWQLALCRLGVGLGESACTPSSHSLLSDYFKPTQRATAMAVYGVGVYLGLGFGFALGGWLNEQYGWRMAFLAGGLPGLVLALLVRVTVREPARGQAEVLEVDQRRYSLVEAFRYIKNHRYFITCVLGTGLFVFSGTSMEYWGATFLMRVHGLGSAEVGAKMGWLGSISGTLGLLAFAVVADRLSLRDLRWYLWIPAIGGALMVPFILFFLFDSGTHLYFYYVLATFFGASYMAPVVALMQRLLPLRMRALGSAIVLLSFNIIGVTAGNLVTGMLSDALTPKFGVDALRYAMALTLVGSLMGVPLMLLSARSLSEKI